MIILVLGFTGYKQIFTKKQTVTYQTTTAEKDTLVVTVTASGQVSTANNASVSTQASGVVTKVYVQNGQMVKTGDPIALLELDLEGRQRSAQAYASYQSAKNNLESAKYTLYSLQSDMMAKWKSFMDTAQSPQYENDDGSPKTGERQLPEYISIDDNWLYSEAKYKAQQNLITQAQTSLNNAWLSYQQTSPTIYAPISGEISGLSLQEGTVLTAQSNTSGTATSQKVASIVTKTNPTISINLTEIDAPKIKIGNKATVTLDAYSGKTYTGRVISVDLVGSTTSGVTNYPAVIVLDTQSPEILPNMSASANVIIQTKADVLLVPLGAVQTQNDQSFIKIMKDGKMETVSVETGLSSDTQIEIVSGLNEGETIITSANNTASNSTQGENRSAFSIMGGGGGGGMKIPR